MFILNTKIVYYGSVIYTANNEEHYCICISCEYKNYTKLF